MPHAIQIPRLGWSMEQGTFVGWLKKNGDNVQPGEPLFTLEGEKAIQEIEAVDAGTLHFDSTNPAEGEIVAVGAIIGYLLAVGETAPPIPRATQTSMWRSIPRRMARCSGSVDPTRRRIAAMGSRR